MKERDPVAWARRVLGVELWSKQEEVLRSVFAHRRTVVPAGHGVGKTFVSAVAVLAFLYLHEPSKVITTAPTWTQVRRLLWSEINRLFKSRRDRRGCPGKIYTTRLQVRDDWFALGLSSTETVNFQGFHQRHVLIVLDEAPGVRREIYEGAETLMSAGDAHLLMIGNPIGQHGHFYEACRSGRWNVIRISCLDSPNVTGEPVSEVLRSSLVRPEWIAEKAEEWGEDSPAYQARILGLFPESADDQLISLGWVDAAVERHREAALTAGPVVIGVDVARYGSDATVYAVLRGDRLEALIQDRGKDTMAVAGRCVALAEQYGAETIGVDEAGVGGGVVDRLTELGVRVVAVNGGERAVEAARFANRRSELWWELREWIRQRGAIPPDRRLREDLTAPRYSFTSRGQIFVEKKEDLRRRLGRSPDRADALALALAARYETRLWEWHASGVAPLTRDLPE
ncbi:MAG: hypothetical protein KatS3mg115_1372 [Candidatus Poribacteria bacterium]|nr:MAG: hypothetical protein KatS3mg115_1372 [Candidatus Poribacteria bacterium]